jgi:hypothetical protein
MTPKVTSPTKNGACLSCGKSATVLYRVPVMNGTQWRWRCKTCIEKRAARNKELKGRTIP